MEFADNIKYTYILNQISFATLLVSDCESKQPKWRSDDADFVVRLSDGGGQIVFALESSVIENSECASEFEVKYWPEGRFESNIMRSSAPNVGYGEDGADHEMRISINATCGKTYSYVLTAVRETPFAEDEIDGEFRSRKCPKKRRRRKKKKKEEEEERRQSTRAQARSLTGANQVIKLP